MSSLLDPVSVSNPFTNSLMHVIPEHALHPGNDFMTGGIGRFVKVDDPRTDIGT